MTKKKNNKKHTSKVFASLKTRVESILNDTYHDLNELNTIDLLEDISKSNLATKQILALLTLTDQYNCNCSIGHEILQHGTNNTINRFIKLINQLIDTDIPLPDLLNYINMTNGGNSTLLHLAAMRLNLVSLTSFCQTLARLESKGLNKADITKLYLVKGIKENLNFFEILNLKKNPHFNTADEVTLALIQQNLIDIKSIDDKNIIDYINNVIADSQIKPFAERIILIVESASSLEKLEEIGTEKLLDELLTSNLTSKQLFKLLSIETETHWNLSNKIIRCGKSNYYKILMRLFNKLLGSDLPSNEVFNYIKNPHNDNWSLVLIAFRNMNKEGIIDFINTLVHLEKMGITKKEIIECLSSKAASKWPLTEVLEVNDKLSKAERTTIMSELFRHDYFAPGDFDDKESLFDAICKLPFDEKISALFQATSDSQPEHTLHKIMAKQRGILATNENKGMLKKCKDELESTLLKAAMGPDATPKVINEFKKSGVSLERFLIGKSSSERDFLFNYFSTLQSSLKQGLSYSIVITRILNAFSMKNDLTKKELTLIFKSESSAATLLLSTLKESLSHGFSADDMLNILGQQDIVGLSNLWFGTALANYANQSLMIDFFDLLSSLIKHGVNKRHLLDIIMLKSKLNNQLLMNILYSYDTSCVMRYLDLLDEINITPLNQYLFSEANVNNDTIISRLHVNDKIDNKLIILNRFRTMGLLSPSLESSILSLIADLKPEQKRLFLMEALSPEANTWYNYFSSSAREKLQQMLNAMDSSMTAVKQEPVVSLLYPSLPTISSTTAVLTTLKPVTSTPVVPEKTIVAEKKEVTPVVIEANQLSPFFTRAKDTPAKEIKGDLIDFSEPVKPLIDFSDFDKQPVRPVKKPMTDIQKQMLLLSQAPKVPNEPISLDTLQENKSTRHEERKEKSKSALLA